MKGGPTTVDGWQAAADDLAEYRRSVGCTSPEEFPDEIGLDGGSLREWAAEDAVDSLKILLDGFGVSVPPEGSLEFASMLATHTQCGIELGLWLVRTGQVTP